ncbi:WhiB family transcriptional regulator [Streptomyces sp. NPDC050523]|uniref:WhiB family transcriptional regulator n=1 Tax=Streptomyces sp. NPDC050523 TaxID=3365622 RepID=UPI0037ADD062
MTRTRAGVAQLTDHGAPDPRFPQPQSPSPTRCQTEPQLFDRDFGDRHKEKELEQARRACSGCPLVTDCLKWALVNENLTTVGIWAATTPCQRKTLRKRLVDRLGPDWIDAVARQDQTRRERAAAARHTPPTVDQARIANAFQATTVSMYYADYPSAESIQATSLTKEETNALAAAQEITTGAPEQTDNTEGSTATVRADIDGSVEQLLAWADTRSAASIRNKAARIRCDLTELTARHTSDDAQRKAEERVATLKSQLERAQEKLKAIKTCTLPTPLTTTATVAAVPTPIRPDPGSRRTKEELADIRAWAQTHDKVADADMIKTAIIDTYDAAHTAPAARAS